MSCRKCGYEVKFCPSCGTNSTYENVDNTMIKKSTKDEKELRILTYGLTGSGVSSTANSILGEYRFKAELSFEPSTIESLMECKERFGYMIKIADTPGFKSETNFCDQMKTFQHIQRSIALLKPGPHVLLLVMPIERYNEEDHYMVRCLSSFKNLTTYILVVFTKIDVINDDIISIKRKISSSESLRELLTLSQGKFELLDNTKNDDEQVRNLVEIIRQTVDKNSQNYFDNDIFSSETKSKLEEIVKERNNQWNMIKQATSDI